MSPRNIKSNTRFQTCYRYVGAVHVLFSRLSRIVCCPENDLSPRDQYTWSCHKLWPGVADSPISVEHNHTIIFSPVVCTVTWPYLVSIWPNVINRRSKINFLWSLQAVVGFSLNKSMSSIYRFLWIMIVIRQYTERFNILVTCKTKYFSSFKVLSLVT